MNRVLTIAFLLAFAGGYADAVSYLLTGSFTGHLTGNTVLLAIHLAQASWREAAANALAVVAFAAGTAASGWTAPPAGKPASARQLQIPLLVEGALGLAALGSRSLGGWVGGTLCMVWLCLMMGQQNGMLRRCGTLSLHTTFITGMSTTLLGALTEHTADHKNPAERSKHQPGTVVAFLAVFVVGALAGACAEGQWKTWSLAGLFLPLIVSLILAVSDKDQSQPACNSYDSTLKQ